MREGAPVVKEPGRAGRSLGGRYSEAMQTLLYERLRPRLTEGVRILDLGGGRSPYLPPEHRPPECRYVGVDIDAAELEAAPEGAYDDIIVADVTDSLPTDELFDVVITWQVLEHVSSMERALGNIREILVPGGVLFAQLSGSGAVFAVLTRLIPYRARVGLMAKLLGHHETDHFPTAYDQCRASDLRRLLAGWRRADIVPYYRGASYFRFSAALQRAYLVYEDFIHRRGADDFATHYLIVAEN